MATNRRLLVLCTVWLLCAGCALDAKRRKAYVAAHPQLDAKVRQAVLEGNVLVGMTEADVEAAMGEPTRKAKSRDKQHGQLDLWVFDRSHEATQPYTSEHDGMTIRTPGPGRVITAGTRVFLKDGKVARCEEY